MIEAKEINFAYRRGIPVLFDINCKIEDGEFVALLGHNGSGKTTLSRLFMALDHPRSGQILVDGEDIVNYEPADLADKVGYVFQNPDLQILADTVYEEVAYGPRVKKLPEENIKTNVKAALQVMGLKGLEYHLAYAQQLKYFQEWSEEYE
jgi:ABC-type cobalt transport system, ATPase component